MNLKTTLKIYGSSGPGGDAVGVKTPGTGVVSPSMRQYKGLTQVEADASPSDLATHHSYQEPSASDITIKNWHMQIVIEKSLGRSMDPFETQATLFMNKLVNLKRS